MRRKLTYSWMVVVGKNSQLPQQGSLSSSVDRFSLGTVIFFDFIRFIPQTVLLLMDDDSQGFLLLQNFSYHKKCGRNEISLRSQTEL